MRYTNLPQATYDRDVEYAIDPRDDGFSIRVSCLRSQLLPKNDAVADACKIALTTIAQEHAENYGTKFILSMRNESRFPWDKMAQMKSPRVRQMHWLNGKIDAHIM